MCKHQSEDNWYPKLLHEDDGQIWDRAEMLIEGFADGTLYVQDLENPDTWIDGSIRWGHEDDSEAVILWKEFTSTMPVSIEYNIEF